MTALGRGLASPRGLAWAAVVALAVVAPFELAAYQNFQLATALAYVPVVAGLAVLTGVAGQASLGQGALFGIGAYTAAILVERAGVPFVAALPAAMAVTAEPAVEQACREVAVFDGALFDCAPTASPAPSALSPSLPSLPSPLRLASPAPPLPICDEGCTAWQN